MAININPSLLRTSAGNLDQVVSVLNEVSNGMKRAHGDISVCWQSDYTPEYLEHLEDVRGKVVDLVGEIQEIQTALRTAAQKVEQAEREAKEIVTNNTANSNTPTGISNMANAATKLAQDAMEKFKK